MSNIQQINEQKNDINRILGENGSAMFETTGNAILDVHSSSTRIDESKTKITLPVSIYESTIEELTRFKEKIKACFNKQDNEGMKMAIAEGFYLRDVKEKGERTLFDIFFICLWNEDVNLAKRLIKFIVGTEDTEYFGSWKDLHQILVLAKKDKDLTISQYRDMYNTFIRFEGIQLAKDWSKFIEWQEDENKNIRANSLSLCAKWLVSAGKSFDEKLTFDGKSYIGNFCRINADLIIDMNNRAKNLNNGDEEWKNSWKVITTNNYIGLQRVLRKVKSNLNTFLLTPEQMMCKNKWSEIKSSSISARNMTKHRRAFNNEKPEKQRKTSSFNTFMFPYGDRFVIETASNELKKAIDDIYKSVLTPDFDNNVKIFKHNFNKEISSSSDLEKAIDRILCRFNITASLVGSKKSIHGARSDLNDLVKMAMCTNEEGEFDPAKINEWVGIHQERALLHQQVQDKIKEISEAIDKIQAEFKKKPTDPNQIRINLKNVIGMYDVSGSMTIGCKSVRPIDVCIGMAYCISQLTRDHNIEHNPIGITFSDNPNIFEIPSNIDFVSACHLIRGQNWGGSTNFEAAFQLILNKAVAEHWKQEDMPEALMVFSDMQFDRASVYSDSFETMYEIMKHEFEAKGYNIPLIVFWNLNGRYEGQNVNKDCKGVITISGYDPAIFKTIIECGTLVTKDVTGNMIKLTPIEVMIKSLTRKRFQPILNEIDNYYVLKNNQFVTTTTTITTTTTTTMTTTMTMTTTITTTTTNTITEEKPVIVMTSEKNTNIL